MIMKLYNKIFFLALCSIMIFSCDPYEEDNIDIGQLPEAPTFTMSVDPANANNIIITNTSVGFYDFIWDISGGFGTEGVPNVSILETDTVLYPDMGVYDITLHAAKIGGSGTSFSTQSVTIDQDAAILCDEKFELLTGGCTSRCWKLKDANGSIQVGPEQLSAEWFSSTGLEPTQLDDTWCFDFSDFSWTYINNGSSFSACQGFVEDPAYPVPTGVSFTVLNSGTDFSTYKILLSAPVWMGVEDSGPEYEIVSISDTEMVLLSPIATCDGSASPGWFTLTFVPA